MPRWQRAYAAVMVAIIGWSLAYVLCDLGRWPRLTYYPYEGDWAFVSGPPGQVPMNYVGTVLWGVAGAIAGAGVAVVGTHLWRRPLVPRAISLLGAWALTSFLFAGTYYMWNLWPF